MDITARIAALLKLTTANGASEAEAMAAAKKAAALMLEYRLTAQDVEMPETNIRARTKGAGARDQLWPVVATCTNTAVVLLDGGRYATMQFIGRAPGPEIAAYLHTVLNRAIDAAVAEFKAGRFYRQRQSALTKRQAVYAFTVAMVDRLSRRLAELFGPTVSKSALEEANEVLARRHGDLVEVKGRGKVSASDFIALSAGLAAGDVVQLAHGGQGEMLALEGGL